MKIPTLFALIFLSLLIILGVGAKSYFAKYLPLPAESNPTLISQSNLSPNSITVSWTSTAATETQLIYTTDKNFLKDLKSSMDDRDKSKTQRNFHFVTLLDLQPQTTYYFKINNSKSNITQQFITPAIDNNQNSKINPLVGSVINSNLQPVGEALVSIEPSGFLPLLTYTSSSGNFVLPIKTLYRIDDLSQTINLGDTPDVTLIIKKDNQISHVDFQFNQLDQALPPIVLGQNLDLRDYKSASSSATNLISTPSYNFDVNGDGKINSVDISIVQSNKAKKTINPKADINSDNVADQKDLDLIKAALK